MKATQEHLEKTINVNGVEIPVFYYNLVLSIRDLKLWIAGIRPHRHWKLKDVKNYFQVTGNATSILEQLEELQLMYLISESK